VAESVILNKYRQHGTVYYILEIMKPYGKDKKKIFRLLIATCWTAPALTGVAQLQYMLENFKEKYVAQIADKGLGSFAQKNLLD
jgi:hypothetical protein